MGCERRSQGDRAKITSRSMSAVMSYGDARSAAGLHTKLRRGLRRSCMSASGYVDFAHPFRFSILTPGSDLTLCNAAAIVLLSSLAW
eukprot:38472-Eustigmatos_ZCMA.PRE.1